MLLMVPQRCALFCFAREGGITRGTLIIPYTQKLILSELKVRPDEQTHGPGAGKNIIK